MSDSEEFSELLAEATTHCEIVKDSLQLGSCQIQYYRPADPESILDDETLLSAHGQLAWQPYWAQAWEAGLGLCQFMLDQPLSNRKILDLGCGIGLTAAWMLKQGGDVACGDNAPPALLFARLNTWPWRDRVSVHRIDWHHTRLGECFEIIVGSDIVYDRAEVPALDRFFRQHLQTAGRVILSDPSRPMTREFLSTFEQLGWILQEASVVVPKVRQLIRIVTMRCLD